MNWVERKFSRDSNAVNGCPEVWQKVLTAVEDACNSFNQNYSDGPRIERSTENGHAVLVRAIFPPKPTSEMRDVGTRTNSVRIVFDERQRLITATLNEKSPMKFCIDADENGCFISYRDNKITPDELSEHALNDAFFKGPAAHGTHPSSPAGFS